MTRVLQRPMFKMGGSTSGITSGLDRPGYYNGKRVASPEEISEYIQTIKGMGGQRTPPLSDFLMNFGLNLMTASPSGNIFTTAAEAAKDPVKGLQQSSADERSLNMNLAAKAMDMLSETDKDIALKDQVEYLISLGEYPDTLEGRRQAANSLRTSKSDLSQASTAEQIDNRTNKYQRDDPFHLAEGKAIYDIIFEKKLKTSPISSQLAQDKHGKPFLKASGSGRKKQLQKAKVGTYFFDLGDRTIKKFDGIEDGQVTWTEVDQETFEEINPDPAVRTNDQTEKRVENIRTPLMQDPLEKQITDITGTYGTG